LHFVSGVKTVLTIAGSDPSGGAGIQADLKTFSSLRVYGMAAIAALTAQNTAAVSAIAEISPAFVAQQLDAVFADTTPDAVKTGMLLTAGVIDEVAQKLRQYAPANIVVDPVMVATSGAPLVKPDGIAALRQLLVPLASVITPNTEEAQKLTGKPVTTIENMEEAALQIHEMGARHVLIKGGHLVAEEATDVLFDGTEFVHFRSPRAAVPETHGTGCVLSAAIAAYLALGKPITEAVRLAKDFITRAIKNGLKIGRGAATCDPLALGN
jgi:hydroxymethylpyrimidine/phosphomethylpyrimidine kinase